MLYSKSIWNKSEIRKVHINVYFKAGKQFHLWLGSGFRIWNFVLPLAIHQPWSDTKTLKRPGLCSSEQRPKKAKQV